MLRRPATGGRGCRRCAAGTARPDRSASRPGRRTAPPPACSRIAADVYGSVPGARPMPRSTRSPYTALRQGELLCNGERRVVGQHHSAGSQSDARGVLPEVHELRRRGGRGYCGHIVVLRDPVAGEAQPVRDLDQLLRCHEGLAGRLALSDGDEVEERKGRRSRHVRGNTEVRGVLPTRLECPVSPAGTARTRSVRCYSLCA